MQRNTSNARPFFIPCTGRRIFALHLPPVETSNGHAFLFIPPFAEEMNKSRHMVRLQAERFAQKGFGSLIMDLTGCGDSSGDHGEAQWDLWKNDILNAHNWLLRAGYTTVNLWGLRLGAMLAVSCCREPEFANTDMILWQPVFRGDVFMTQFLRLRMAADLSAKEKESTKEMRRKLANGKALEVAGYDLSPTLFKSIDDLRLIDLAPSPSTQVLIVESTPIEPAGLTPAAEVLIGAWKDRGVLVEAQAVIGEPFWSTQEITVNAGFIDQTEAAVYRWIPPTSNSHPHANQKVVPQFAALKEEARVQLTPNDTGGRNPFGSAVKDSAILPDSGDNSEFPLVFECEQSELIGILHRPPLLQTEQGVIIVVGGPQYRVGSHRQFVLLARYLAKAGIPVLRFDYRGMGDSGGQSITFEDSMPDIKAATDAFFRMIPQIDRVVLWGLCDAVSAICLGACADSRVSAAVLLNPWVRTEEGEAQTIVKHYYKDRIMQSAFWKKMFRGQIDWRQSISSLWALLRRSRGEATVTDEHLALPDRMAAHLNSFHGRLLLILSGNDLTADEFREVCKKSKLWRSIVNGEQCIVRELAESNHTFSKRIWRDQVAQWTREFVQT